jgi:hypothetical protein
MVKERRTELVGFRHSVPYINAHRGKTFVIMLGGEAIEHENFSSIVNDIGLLHSLGIRLVVVYGAARRLTPTWPSITTSRFTINRPASPMPKPLSW